jgi:DNA (cytosine-5)-methyltransferase 1
MICTDITGPLTARDYKGISSDDCNPTMMKLIAYENHPADSRVKEMGDTCATVTSRWGTGGGNVPFVQAIAFEPGIAKREGGDSRFTEEFSPTLRKEMGDNQVAVAYSIREDAKANTFSATELDVANSIGALQPSPQSHHAQVFVAQPIVLEDQGGSVINTSQTGIVGTLRRETHGHEPSIVAHAFKVRGGCEGGGKGYLGKDEQVFTISTHQDQHIAVGVDMYNLTTSQNSTQTLRGNGHIDHVGGIMQQMAVRRLTPKECERLQGFPDGYTDIRPKGKDTPDGSRYKALGNSWAVPVVAWIGKRINHAIT